MVALNIAAMPRTIKFRGITLALKKVFRQMAVNNPTKAPMKRLGANTPPAPPEESVIEVTIGFMMMIDNNVRAREMVRMSVFAERMLCFMA